MMMNASRFFDYKILSFVGAGIILLSPFYYAIGRIFQNDLSIFQAYMFTSITAVAILIGYKIFFFIQIRTLNRKSYAIDIALDKYVPFFVQWVWVYGFLYYILIGLPVAFFSHIGQCLTFIAGGFAVILTSLLIFLIWPTTCPPEWRRYEQTGISSRFLAFIQRFDLGRNCWPSMHCALSAYTATFIPSSIFVITIPTL